MEILNIVPGESIGTVKIGMTQTQAEAAMMSYDGLNISYDEDHKVDFIEIGYGANDQFKCVYGDFDLFNTKASELVSMIDQISPYDRNEPEIGYTYKYPKIGLSLWRSTILTEEDLQEDWFKELSADIQEDEMKHLYFEAVAVYKPSK
ncbi:hypothetical protein [Paenibacillus sanfengchensis]|uniref:hypothetical protein n=1 Tax=Paenibacillus sanfengchensis TaxID=3119819 RepID=UPI002FE2DDF5